MWWLTAHLLLSVLLLSPDTPTTCLPHALYTCRVSAQKSLFQAPLGTKRTLQLMPPIPFETHSLLKLLVRAHPITLIGPLLAPAIRWHSLLSSEILQGGARQVWPASWWCGGTLVVDRLHPCVRHVAASILVDRTAAVWCAWGGRWQWVDELGHHD